MYIYAYIHINAYSENISQLALAIRQTYAEIADCDGEGNSSGEYIYISIYIHIYIYTYI